LVNVLFAGDSRDEAVLYLVRRYAEFILLKSDVVGMNWVAAHAMFQLALGAGWGAVRCKSDAVGASLTGDEQSCLNRILKN
jgi:cytochrome c-type biogenesis protein CcmH